MARSYSEEIRREFEVIWPARRHGGDLRRGRVSETGRIYLVTTVTFQRQPLFSDHRFARAVVEAMKSAQQAGQAETLCHVVMPDHLHWLFVLSEGCVLSRLVQTVKSRSARRINGLRGGIGPVWQVGFHDHALRRDEAVRDVARYVVANPLRAGLAQRLGDYPHWDAVWL